MATNNDADPPSLDDPPPVVDPSPVDDPPPSPTDPTVATLIGSDFMIHAMTDQLRMKDSDLDRFYVIQIGFQYEGNSYQNEDLAHLFHRQFSDFIDIISLIETRPTSATDSNPQRHPVTETDSTGSLKWFIKDNLDMRIFTNHLEAVLIARTDTFYTDYPEDERTKLVETQAKLISNSFSLVAHIGNGTYLS